MTPSVVVIGAGVSGLSCACALLDETDARGAPLDLTVLEAGATAGGHAQTETVDGFVIERGPNGFLSREPETLDRIARLGLTPRLVEANGAMRRRFIVRNGKLRRVPDGPRTLVTSGALSWRGVLRLLGEPWASGPPAQEETVHQFATRRLGREAADILVDTAVSGLSAGDSHLLSVAAQLPAMVEMEREHGGLARAMFARRSRKGASPRLLSIDGGLGALTGAMAARVGSRLETSRAVTCVAPASAPAGWTVHVAHGTPRRADHVILATAARAGAPLVEGFDEPLARALAAIPLSGLAVVALGYRTADVHRPRDGYGYLVPRAEGLATLGVLWESSMFPGRAPEGHLLVRVFLGGARRPDVVSWDDTRLVDTAREELGSVTGITAAPVLTRTYRIPDAIAQYTLGHLDRRAAIAAHVSRHAGLHVCGTSYDGVSLNHAVSSGHRTARAVVAAIAETADVPTAAAARA